MDIIKDVWLCTDCMIAAVNDDYSGLSYHYGEAGATRRMDAINRGLEALPGLVPDFGGEDPEHVECRDCDWSGPSGDLKTMVVDGTDDDFYSACPECGGEWREKQFDNGEEEFSRRECDCCGGHLAGARFRFAQLVADTQTQE